MTDPRKLLELLIEKAPQLRAAGVTFVDLEGMAFEMRAEPEPAPTHQAADDDEPDHDRGPYAAPSGPILSNKKRGH